MLCKCKRSCEKQGIPSESHAVPNERECGRGVSTESEQEGGVWPPWPTIAPGNSTSSRTVSPEMRRVFQERSLRQCITVCMR